MLPELHGKHICLIKGIQGSSYKSSGSFRMTTALVSIGGAYFTPSPANGRETPY
jgi:hypothetical protein